MVYISLHYQGYSFTNSFAALATKTIKRCHPAYPADALGCFSHPLCHVCKVKPCRCALNFPTLALSFQSHQFLGPDHFKAAVTLLLV